MYTRLPMYCYNKGKIGAQCTTVSRTLRFSKPRQPALGSGIMSIKIDVYCTYPTLVGTRQSPLRL